MANFFQPGDPKTTVESTKSPADAALTKFKAELLGRFLESMGGNRPNFAEFAKGGSATKPFPTGFGGDVSSLLEALNQPGAFTSQTATNFNLGSPSGMSDLSQLLGLGLGLNNLLGNPLAAIGGGAADFLGGLLGLSKPSQLNPNDVPSNTAGLFGGQSPAAVGGAPWGGGGQIDPGTLSILGAGDPSLLGPGYGVLQDSGLANWNWGS